MARQRRCPLCGNTIAHGSVGSADAAPQLAVDEVADAPGGQARSARTARRGRSPRGTAAARERANSAIAAITPSRPPWKPCRPSRPRRSRAGARGSSRACRTARSRAGRRCTTPSTPKNSMSSTSRARPAARRRTAAGACAPARPGTGTGRRRPGRSGRTSGWRSAAELQGDRIDLRVHEHRRIVRSGCDRRCCACTSPDEARAAPGAVDVRGPDQAGLAAGSTAPCAPGANSALR